MDVSLELSNVCVVDGRGKIVKEAKVASEPEALVCFFKELGVPVNRIGLEAGPLSQWLHAGLTQAGFQTVLLETRHVKGNELAAFHRSAPPSTQLSTPGDCCAAGFRAGLRPL